PPANVAAALGTKVPNQRATRVPSECNFSSTGLRGSDCYSFLRIQIARMQAAPPQEGRDANTAKSGRYANSAENPVSLGVIKPSSIGGHPDSGESRRYERVLNTMDETLESSNLGNDSKPNHVANRAGSDPGGTSGQHPSAHEQPAGGPGGN